MEALLGKTIKRWYKASEFARLTGVTVRTLHHYDRLGLLKPSGHTEAGYRLYGERDFARLQQIVVLKFIGFPLKQIKNVLDNLYADQSNWPSTFEKPCSGEVGVFIGQAMAISRGKEAT